MKYLVMECRPGYAVVVDEDGKFLKVANRRYEVGQTVTDVVPMQVSTQKKNHKWIYSLAAMAACLMLLLTTVLPGSGQPYASVYVKINPEVRIDVDKQDRVVSLEGVNQDGIDLIAGYDYHKKDLDLVTDELVDRAIDMGYLHAEGQITVSLDSKDQQWVEQHSHSISDHLQTHMQEKFVVTIEIKLCTHEHPGKDHRDYDYDDDEDDEEDAVQETPTQIQNQPDWDEDDQDDHHEDDHDDFDDDDDDVDDMDDDEDEDDDFDDDDDEDEDIDDAEEPAKPVNTGSKPLSTQEKKDDDNDREDDGDEDREEDDDRDDAEDPDDDDDDRDDKEERDDDDDGRDSDEEKKRDPDDDEDDEDDD